MSTADGFEVGYWLSSEEHGPRALVRHAVRAEAAGFRAAMISDHFHPWTPTQGQAPFVWSVLGALSEATTHLHLATGVTAPIMRIHPAIVAQAAATAAVQLPGRFALGLGTGERLNEHVTGTQWPRPGIRRRMLEEAIDVITKLLAGDEVIHDGKWFTVEHAQLYTVPDVAPPIWLAASGRRSAQLAGRVAQGLIALAPDPSLVEAYTTAGGAPGMRVGQLHVCVAESEDEARHVARTWWPNGALPGRAATDLERPADYEAFCALVTEDAVAESVLCGPDVERHIAALARFAGAGFDRVYVHQVGPDQEALFRLYESEVLPVLARAA
jgi:coenzyme F420-dependent glucose-6-phosphate dehydrogenase